MQPTRPMIKFCLAPDIGYAEVELEVCQLCQKIQVIRGTVALSKPEMIQHLLDVHDVREPEVEKHYVTHTLPNMASCDEYGFPIYNRFKARSG
ncbi:unnamed protein product [Rhizoctonia solani]|uniref:Uncharacterized protein n=1 Tax=Rhizoctonia solani TaxID=456999 RepID=A0A8H3E2X1_9AGAM|nr:unnamed protein product [Rhizoctonia solani]